MKACFFLGTMILALGTNSIMAAGSSVLSTHVPAAVTRLGLQPTGRLEPSKELRLNIGLPWRNREALTQLVRDIYDPQSPNYNKCFSTEEFTQMFGPSQQDYATLILFAKTNGLIVTATHPNRKLLDVAGPVSAIENAFHITLKTYKHPKESRVFYAPDTEPSLELAVPVLHIDGLDNYFVPHLKLNKTHPKPQIPAPRGGSGIYGSYTGYDFRAAYAPDVTLTGSGQVVGLFEMDGYYPDDISKYEAMTGLPNVPLTDVHLNGFNGTPVFTSGACEVAFNIELCISMAPGLSQIIIYETSPFSDGLQNSVLNRMATDNLAKQLCFTWGWSGGPNTNTDEIFLQMAAQHQSFFCASGDYGAYAAGSVDNPSYDNAPSDNPYITIVGGTSLVTTGPLGPWVSESVWNQVGDYGSGGGISSYYSTPTWQSGIDMPSRGGSASSRNIPDVAMVADSVCGVANNITQYLAGTSCSAPLWAGFNALVNQQAAANGRPAVGFINPALYAIAKSADYPNCFHDITTGNNTNAQSPTLFYAAAGYDLCTGLGTPKGMSLINALAPPLPITFSLQTSPAGKGLTVTATGNGQQTTGDSFSLECPPGTTYALDLAASQTGNDGNTYNFQEWSDGVTSASRSITLTKDVRLEAIFTNATAQTLIANSSADSFVESTEPGTNFGNSNIILVSPPNPGPEAYGLLKFDLSSIPQGSTINQAVLRLTPARPNTSDVTVYEVNGPWSESSVTWNNKPPSGGGILFIPAGSQPVSVSSASLLSLVQSWVKTPGGNNGLYLFADGGGWASFYSREEPTTGRPPQLTVSYFPLLLTKVISLSGNLAFGVVKVGKSAQQVLTINNSGTSTLTVSKIRYPSGFSGNWSSGAIGPGGSQNVAVSFSPSAVQAYGGNIAIDSDATSGINTIAASGTGIVPATGVTHYVSPQSTNPTAPYSNWLTAATNIQDAVNAAAAGDFVVVTNGVYSSVSVGSPLTLLSVNGPQSTIIAGGGPCVSMTDGASLTGFTVTGGASGGLGTSRGRGAGVMCYSTNAFLTNCMIVRNAALYGGQGGGVYGGTLFNCKLYGNVAYALYWFFPPMTFPIIEESQGGGAMNSTLYNCTLVGNNATAEFGWMGVAPAYGGGAYGCSLYNCVVYGNDAWQSANCDGSCTLNYCCVPALPNANGVGNITSAPFFVDAANGNLRLQSNSPCINAGNNGYVATATDLDSRPRICGGTVDIGAYEYRALLVSRGNLAPMPPYAGWTAAATNIQDAVDIAVAGDQVVVSNGVYDGGVSVTKPLMLLSLNGPQSTIITGGGPCISLSEGTSLIGFTLTNGSSYGVSGGGVSCTSTNVFLTNCLIAGNSVQPDEFGNGGYGGGAYGGTLFNCTIVGNSAVSSLFGYGYSDLGGGAAASVLHNCTLVGNSAFYGGGAHGCTLYSCTLTDNFAVAESFLGNGGFGGGAEACGLYNCLLIGNSAEKSGGGAANSSLFNCVLTGNSAPSGIGGGAWGGALYNCILNSNSAHLGGGVYYGTLNNCTLIGNSSNAVCNATLYNCITYFNTASGAGNYDSYSSLNYCCTTPLPDGLGNITNAPLFVDFAGGNLDLQSNSPCINAGKNGFVTTTTDFDGNPRIVSGTVDVGAYEYQGTGSKISYAWLQQYGLPTDGSADFIDSDGDGLNNWQEWICGTDPTNPTSALRLISAAPTGTNTIVTWQSVAGVNYFLQGSTDLRLPFTLLATNLVGQAGTTTCAVTNAFATAPYFYRVGVSSP